VVRENIQIKMFNIKISHPFIVVGNRRATGAQAETGEGKEIFFNDLTRNPGRGAA
jgi:hypothetical protein